MSTSVIDNWKLVLHRLSYNSIRNAVEGLSDRLKKWPRVPKTIARRLVRSRRARLLRGTRHAHSNERVSRLLVDISVISRNDSQTGIQRVVRAILWQLQNEAPQGLVVQPIVATRKQPYRLASWPSVAPEPGEILSPKRGDVFLGLDLSAHIVPARLPQMARWKASGVRFYFVIYDLLPLEHPAWFSAKLVRAFRRWIQAVAVLSDGVFCISQIVDESFRSFLTAEYNMRRSGITTQTIPMGSHIADSVPSKGLPTGFADVLKKLDKSTILMVGTIEPRKGHREVFDALECLWKRGSRVKLVIVGRPGWKTGTLQREIREHPEFGRSLFWFDGVSDEALECLYQTCAGVVLASKAEGLGLPLLEALSYRKPILARDLRVFRHISHSLVCYFDQFAETEELARSIDHWVRTECSKSVDTEMLSTLSLPSWRDSMNSILAHIESASSVENTRKPVITHASTGDLRSELDSITTWVAQPSD